MMQDTWGTAHLGQKELNTEGDYSQLFLFSIEGGPPLGAREGGGSPLFIPTPFPSLKSFFFSPFRSCDTLWSGRDEPLQTPRAVTYSGVDKIGHAHFRKNTRVLGKFLTKEGYIFRKIKT
jgi:hypothetical protein